MTFTDHKRHSQTQSQTKPQTQLPAICQAVIYPRNCTCATNNNSNKSTRSTYNEIAIASQSLKALKKHGNQQIDLAMFCPVVACLRRCTNQRMQTLRTRADILTRAKKASKITTSAKKRKKIKNYVFFTKYTIFSSGLFAGCAAFWSASGCNAAHGIWHACAVTQQPQWFS